MKRQRKTQAGAGIILLMAALLCMPLLVQAGSLEPPGAPAPTMYTLQQVYDKLLVIEGEIGDSAAPVAKTGQTATYAAGDDGALRKGVAVPIPRFTDNGNGTVRDNLTNLIWLKNAAPTAATSWANALVYCNTLASGSAGLTDGSVAGDWRLPNIKEFISIMNFSVNNPCLTSGHPFTGFPQSTNYWSSTTDSGTTTNAFQLGVGTNGGLGRSAKTTSLNVWPVRGGN